MKKNLKLGCFLLLVGSFHSSLSSAQAINNTIDFPHDAKGTVNIAMNLHQDSHGVLNGWRIIKEPKKEFCEWIDYKDNTIIKDETSYISCAQSQHPVSIQTPNGLTVIALPLVSLNDNTYSESVVAQINFDNEGNLYNVKVNRGQGSIINLDSNTAIVSHDDSKNYSQVKQPVHITIKTANGEITHIDLPAINTRDKNSLGPVMVQVNFDSHGNVTHVKKRDAGDEINMEQALSEEFFVSDTKTVSYQSTTFRVKVSEQITHLRNQYNTQNKKTNNNASDDVYVRRFILNLP